MRLVWLLGQVLLVLAWGALLIAAVIAVWYGFSLIVLTAVSRLFRFRGRTPDPPDNWNSVREQTLSGHEPRTHSDQAPEIIS